MRVRRLKWATSELDESSIFIREGASLRGHWRERFSEPTRPLHLELGCGKGGFISQLAPDNLEINFIAVDMIDNMLGLAHRKVQAAYKAMGREPQNILLLFHDVTRIQMALAPEDAVARIYINFCNPWPKRQHKKRRLTHPRQLAQYLKFLTPQGEIHFKTDDDALFAESLMYFEECDFLVERCEWDLHSSDLSTNILTEHEQMFSEQGIPIKYCVCRPRNTMDILRAGKR